jgi:cobalt-zinc-cadmium efflux system outer membrane protein
LRRASRRSRGSVAISVCVLAALRFGAIAAAQPPPSAAPPASVGAGTPTLSMDDAVAVALEHNLELQVSAREIDAARARQTGASLLLAGNPEVTTAAGPRLSDSGDSVDWGVALSQRVEIAGQRGARMEVAEAGLRAAEARLAARRSALAADVREAFGRVVAAEQLVAVATEAEMLAADGLAAASDRQEAGDASVIEVNVARIETGSASREASAAEQARQNALGALKLLLGLPAYHSVQATDDLAPTGLCNRSLDDLLAEARAGRGDLLAARAELDRAQAEQRLAEREAVVSPSIGISYNREEGADIVQATISVPLPISDRNQAARGVTGAGLAQARLALQSLERSVEQEVGLALARCKASRAAMESYRGEIVRAAQANLALANEGYRAGKIDFLQLLLIRREALAARRAASESLQEWNAAEAQMMRVTGNAGAGRR